MLWHNKSAVSMTFVCFSIAKLECQKSLVFLFSLLYAHAWYAQKEKYAKTIQSKKIKMLLNMIVSVYSRRCGSYRMYLEGDSSHQTIMIVCELKWFSHIPNHHNMLIHLQSCDVFHTQHTKFFTTLDTCACTIWFGHHKVYMC